MAITSFFSHNIRNCFGKKIILFWLPNGTIKIKLLEDQVHSITHEVDLWVLSLKGPLGGTDTAISKVLNLLRYLICLVTYINCIFVDYIVAY